MNESSILNSVILIVDDQEPNVDILTSLLDYQGYTRVISTTDSRQVIDLVRTHKPDLILLDLLMPYLTGFEVLQLLQKEQTDQSYLPVLVLTADVTTETRKLALTNGATDFLTKPFDLIEVGLRIKNLLATKQLHKQLQNQNQLLEDKVKERTQELVLSNQELIRARDKAEESNRLKTAFLNNISHEIRTPLNGIMGFAPFIVSPDVSQHEKDVYLDYLNLSCNRLMDTITDFMDMSLLVSGSMKAVYQEVSIDTICTKLVAQFGNACNKKGLSLLTQHPELPVDFTFTTDPQLLTKALIHVMNNAVKFTNSGTVTIGCDLQDTNLVFRISDTGVGIAQEIKQHIFEAFMQGNVATTRNYEGSGLGLSIAHGICELLGGSLQIESEPDQGTTVRLTMPLSPPHSMV